MIDKISLERCQKFHPAIKQDIIDILTLLEHAGLRFRITQGFSLRNKVRYMSRKGA